MTPPTPSNPRKHGVFSRRGLPVRLVYLLIASGVWLATLGGRFRRDRVVVLCYHAVRSEHADRFERQMRALRGRAISIDHLDDPAPAPPRALVTFDDAFACLLTHALPALHTHDIPAVIYAVADVLGTTPAWEIASDHPEKNLVTMTPEQIGEIAADPLLTIGAHSCSHPRLTACSEADLRDELVRARWTLEERAGAPVTDLAYPHGDHDGRVDRAAAAAGYTTLATLGSAVETLGPRESPLLHRFLMDPDAWPIEFRLTIDGAYGWLAVLRRWTARRRTRAAATRLAPRESAA